MAADTLTRLAHWFEAQVDGDWEHGFGVRIESLDNPGWRVRIALVGSGLEDAPFASVSELYEDPTQWLRCWRTETEFEVACGVPRLADALDVFLDWAASAPPLKRGNL